MDPNRGEPGGGQAPSGSSANYRDRPTDDGEHGDAGAEQAENLPNSDNKQDDRR
jgi:hypothetical protein